MRHLVVTNRATKKITLGQPVGPLSQNQIVRVQVSVADVERLAPDLHKFQNAGLILFDLGPDPDLSDNLEYPTINEIGLGSGGASFFHTQVTAASTWVINHNLGFIPTVAVFTNGYQQVMANIVHLSVNTTNVVLAIPMSGFARFV